jgi:hypothetical protein
VKTRRRPPSLHSAVGGDGFGSRAGWLLFLTLWLAYGVAVNTGNLEAFNLQHAGVEAYVERGQFHLGGSGLRRFQFEPVVDVFLYDGRLYAAKQPGQFMAGAAVYFLLRRLGLSYSGNYLLTAALVTFFTSSLVTAAAGLAVFRLARELTPGGPALFWPLLSALAYGLGSTAFAYSGVAWHDSLAAGYLTIALYLVVRLPRETSGGRGPAVRAACAGLLLGLTLTTSMLPAPAALVLSLYFVGQRRWRLLPYFALGGVAGLAPLLVHNAVSFGHPFLMPNVAGDYADTYPRLSSENFAGKVSFYARTTALHAPVFWLGLAGLALFPRGLRREQALVASMLVALAAYVLNIGADGTCQYGPRYLLPAMPLACLGLVGFGRLRGPAGATAAWAAVVCCAASFIINLIGAAHGAMLCDFRGWAAARLVSEALRGGARSYPLAPWLALPLAVCAAALARTLNLAGRRPPRAAP